MSSNPSRRPSFYYSEARRAVFTTFWISAQQLQSDDNSGLVWFLTTWSEQNKTLSLKRAHAKTLVSEKKVSCVPAISFQSSPVGILPLLLILLRVISLRELISCEEYLECLTRSSIWLSWWKVLLIVCPPVLAFEMHPLSSHLASRRRENCRLWISPLLLVNSKRSLSIWVPFLGMTGNWAMWGLSLSRNTAPHGASGAYSRARIRQPMLSVLYFCPRCSDRGILSFSGR